MVHQSPATEVVLARGDITRLDVLVNPAHLRLGGVVKTTKSVQVQPQQVPVGGVTVLTIRHVLSTRLPVPDHGRVEAVLTERLLG